MDGGAVGLGLREVWLDELEQVDRRALDLLEVMIDDARGCAERRSRWRRLGARWPLVAHRTDLGIGDAEGVDPGYVGAIADAVRALQCRWYFEHLAFLRAGEVDLGHFGPVFDDDAAMRALRANAEEVSARVGRALLLENPSDILGWGKNGDAPGEHLGRSYARALEAADCGALLDLTNLVYDARNGGWSPESYLAQLPMERVVQVHLAGGRQVGDLSAAPRRPSRRSWGSRPTSCCEWPRSLRSACAPSAGAVSSKPNGVAADYRSIGSRLTWAVSTSRNAARVGWSPAREP